MSNLKTAKLAVEAEISHARQGMSYYAARVKSLEQALAELDNVGEEGKTSSEAVAKPKKAEKIKAAGKAVEKRAKKSNGKAENSGAGAGELPRTNSEFWINLMSDQPQHGAEVLKAAIRTLGFDPDKEQVKKLQQRMTFTLNSLVRANKIKDSGSGRERVFLKSDSAAS